MTTHKKSNISILLWIVGVMCLKILLDGLSIYLWDRNIAELVAEFLKWLSMQ